MSRSLYKFHEAECPYFFTCAIAGWLPVFTRPKASVSSSTWKFLQGNHPPHPALTSFVPTSPQVGRCKV